VHDKKTLCMKPDMKIGLQFDVVKGHCEYSDFLALQQLFASRLLSFLTKHPKVFLCLCISLMFVKLILSPSHYH
jgi:chromatin licensing and DNA replication factor 1